VEEPSTASIPDMSLGCGMIEEPRCF